MVRRAWLTNEEFLDRLGATNLIPGPSTTELAIYIGFLRAGWTGLAVAGACYMFPAAAIVTALAWLYTRFGQMPEIAGLLYGLKPAVVALVIHSLWKLGRASVRTPFLAILGLIALAAGVAGGGPLAVILGAGLVSGWRETLRVGAAARGAAFVLGAIGLALVASQILAIGVGPGTPLGQPSTGNVFLYFLRTGTVIFGGGVVLVAFLQKDLVTHVHWVTSRQLLDAVAIGWVTPGPVFTTATFLGFVLRGFPGAIAATVGIFLPSFFACAASGPMIPRLRASTVTGAFLDGVTAASIALMAAVSWDLGRAALVDPFSIGLAAVSLAVLFRFDLNAAWLVLAGGALGLLAHPH